MTKLIFSVFFILGGIIFVPAQQPATQSTPNPAGETLRIIREQGQADSRLKAMRNGGNRTNNNSSRNLAIQNIVNIYRKPTKDEFELLAPNKEDFEKHAHFLRQSNTGLLKLVFDQGCAENTNVLKVSEACRRYSMPGAGSSYSFRTENYRIGRLADLTFTGNGFESSGILSHSMLVNVGDISLDQISLQTKGLKFLNEFQSTADFDKAVEIDRQFIGGIEKDGFVYRRRLPVEENTTYILRSIAYRGNNYRTVQGVLYDEFDFDKRKDITVAFRIIRRDAEGVTIIWKRLSEKDAPKVKKTKKEEAQINQSKFLAGKSGK